MSETSYYDVLKELADVSDFDNPTAKTLVSLFEDERFKKMSIEHQLQYIGIASVLLAAAIDTATDKKFSWDTLNVASQLMHPLGCEVFNSLYGVAAMDIAWKQRDNICGTPNLEYFYHGLFNKHIEKIFNCKVVKRGNDHKNIPDSWVEYNGEIIPVEIKRGNFNESALYQLKRYMDTYNTSFGMAVGRNYTASDSDNIIFVPISFLENCENGGK